MDTIPVFIAVHGGAGIHPNKDEDVKAIRRGLKRACETALMRCSNNPCALMAVVEAVSSLEDDENFNAGYGSNLTIDGKVECDASIMNQDGDFASVVAVAGIKNPIRTAHLLLENSKNTDTLGRIAPMTLVGEGARVFVESQGDAERQMIDPKTLITPRSRKEWEKWKSRLENSHCLKDDSEDFRYMQDTIGAVALTQQEAAGAVSSGGLLLKLPGRMGEAGVYGAGCWAQVLEEDTLYRRIACSTSGAGEEIIRLGLSRSICEQFISSKEDVDIHEILETTIRNASLKRCRQLKDSPFSIGVIAIAQCSHEDTPRMWCAFTTPSMAIGYVSSRHTSPKAAILRRSDISASSGSTASGYRDPALPSLDESLARFGLICSLDDLPSTPNTKSWSVLSPSSSMIDLIRAA